MEVGEQSVARLPSPVLGMAFGCSTSPPPAALQQRLDPKNPIRKPRWHPKFPLQRLGTAIALQCKPKHKRKMDKKDNESFADPQPCGTLGHRLGWAAFPAAFGVFRGAVSRRAAPIPPGFPALFDPS